MFTALTRPTFANESSAFLSGTMFAEAETEVASLDCVFDEELLLSSDTVGIAVGVEAVAAQAERNNAITNMTIYVFFILVLRLSVGFAVLCDDTVLKGNHSIGITDHAWI